MGLPLGIVEMAQRRPAVPIVASILALAGLDIAGAALARHWAEHRAAASLLGGLVVFSVLFVVYGRSVHYAELSTVTIGWVVVLQVGVVIMDRLRGVALPPHKLVVIAAILSLQAVLVLDDLR
jgi:hypothetical protein